MWGSKKKLRPTRIDTLVGQQTELHGDVHFSGGLHVDGVIKGCVIAEDESGSMLTLSEHGTIEGEVKVPNVVINGTVIGDVRARHHVELAANARIAGDVYYNLIEMAIGSEVNGSLVRSDDEIEPPLKLSHDTPLEVAD